MTEGYQLTRAALDTEMVALKALVDSIKEATGNQAKRLSEATEQALGVAVNVSERPTFDVEDGGEGGAVVDLAVVAQYVVDLNSWADQLRNETVTGILNATGGPIDLDALKTAYADKRTMVEALITVLRQTGIDSCEGVEIPGLRAGRPVGSTNRKAGSKFAHFYRVLADGEKRGQSAQQDTYSSFAYYHSAKMMGGDRVGVDQLTAWLKAEHDIDSPMGKPWSVVVDGVTYGMETAGDQEE